MQKMYSTLIDWKEEGSPQVTRERVLEEGICLFPHLWCLLTVLTIPQEASVSSVIVELQRDIVILRAFLE